MITSNRIGIIAENSIEYVDFVFSILADRKTAVPLRSIDDKYRIDAAKIDQIIAPAKKGGWYQKLLMPRGTNESAFISFTSGTEGSPKGVILTHNNLEDVVNRLNSLMQLDNSINEYIGVPVYHSFGFGRCRAVSTVGGRFFIPSNGFNPSEIGKMLRNGEINAISAVPSLWRLLLDNKDAIGNLGQKVRWIEIGSQYMNRQEKEAMKNLFPEAIIVQHYGLTEASRTTLLQIHQLEGDLLESVGQPYGSVEVKLTSGNQIKIRGNHVAHSYLIDGQDVALQDDDGWFLTKDLGRLERGYLYYEGRADDVINCGGIKIYPEALEPKVYARVGCTRGLAICRKSDLMRGDGFLVVLEMTLKVDKQKIRKAVVEAAQELGVNAANAITIVDIDALPETATGKIQRKQLVEWYAQISSDEDQSIISTNTIPTANSPIQAIFYDILNISKIEPQDSFVSLYGDSLSYIQFSLRLEDYLGMIPKGWEHMTLKELETLIPEQPRVNSIETDVFLRAVSILFVVFNHIGQTLIPEEYFIGGSLLLLILSGYNFARFQSNKLLSGTPFKSIAPMFKSILVPYIFINLIYQLKTHNIRPSVLLMINNFRNPMAQNVDAQPFPYWFICVLVQVIILFTSLFYIKKLRDFANNSPWFFGINMFIIGVCVNILSMRLFFPKEVFFPRLPNTLFWLFTLGWCLYFSNSRLKKIVTTGIFLIAMSMIDHIGGLTSEKKWILLGGIILLWIPFIPVPKVIKSVLRIISSATFYIYMTHVLFITLIVKIGYKIGVNNPYLTYLISIFLCILLMFAFQKLSPKIKTFFLA